MKDDRDLGAPDRDSRGMLAPPQQVNSDSGWSLARARTHAAGYASLEFSHHVLLLLDNVHLGSHVFRTIR